MHRQVGRLTPGLVAAAEAAVGGWAIQYLTRSLGISVLVAVLLGLLVGNLHRLHHGSIAPGAALAATHLLQTAIVLLGIQLALHQVLDLGLLGLGLIVGVMLLVAIGGRLLGLHRSLTALLAVGMAVCGNIAIAATAPVIAAKPGATDAATVVKLIRNTFIAPIVALAGVVHSRRGEPDSQPPPQRRQAGYHDGTGVRRCLRRRHHTQKSRRAPYPPRRRSAIASKVLIIVAPAGVGMQTDIVAMRSSGIRPFVVGSGAALLVAVLTFLSLSRGAVVLPGV